MSQIGEDVYRDITLAEEGLGDSISTPQTQIPQEDFYPSDGSEALFSMYLDRVIEEDRRMVESWKGDADRTLTATGLFSAAVAGLLTVSIPDIRPSSQDAAAFYLAHIYQQSFTQPNGSRPSIPSSLSDPTQPFSPPAWSVWVNGLWFLSFVINLSCALLATSLHQWARQYERLAYRRYGPHRRARIHAFYRHGVEKWQFHRAVEVLPMLLHTSLFLFISGLSVFLFGVHRTIFNTVAAWISLCTISYGVLSLFPIIQKNGFYSTPLSALFSFYLTGVRYIFFRLLQRFPHIDPSICMPLRSRDPRTVHLDDFFSHSMNKTAEQYALKLNPSIDYHTLLWTFWSLNEDSDLEKFFEGLSRLCDSERGKYLNLLQGFIVPNKRTLSNALIEMMNRTLSSNLAPEFVKQRRLIICTKAIESTSLFGPRWILRRVLLGGWHRFLGCIEFGLFVQNWKDIAHPVTLFYRQCVATLTISIVRDHDDRWNQLVSGLLDVSKTLHGYIGNDDNIPLANAIFIVRRTVQTYSGSAERHRNDIIGASSKTLETVCKLDIRSTLPELQHEFCGVWNQLVAVAQSDPTPHHGFVTMMTLKNIRKLYIALHECSVTPPTVFYTTTHLDPILDDPKSYPMCTIDDHLPSNPIPDLQFDEAPPDFGDGLPTPSMTPMLAPTYPSQTSFPPSNLYHSLSVPFLQPRLTRSDALNVEPVVNVRSSPPPPRISTSSVPSIHLDNAPTTSEDGAPERISGFIPGFFHSSIPLGSTGFSVPDFPPFRVAPSSNPDPSQSTKIPFYPTDNVAMPRLRTRGLMNRGNMCFVNAILQLLVHCPSFWNIFRELGELMEKYRAGKNQKSDAGMTPLVDATLKFLGEFVYEENSRSQTPQSQQHSTRDNPSGDEGKKEHNAVDSFEPTHMYDVMKGKAQLRKLLDSQQQDAEEFFDAYLEALDEELLLLLDSISTHKSPEVEEHDVSQSGRGKTDLRMQDDTANSMESPITRIFSSKLRSTASTTDQPSSDSVENWRSLRLDILNDSVCTIEDALAHFSQLQSGLSFSGEASDKVLIESLPPVLVLYFNRSTDYTTLPSIVKIAKSIPFSPMLDIPPGTILFLLQRQSRLRVSCGSVDPEILAHTARPLSGPARYKLSSVLYHHGEFTGSGHYTVDVLDSNTEGDSRDVWLHIDDETVNKVHLEDEFPGGHKARARDQCSSMLFYHRTTVAKT